MKKKSSFQPAETMTRSEQTFVDVNCSTFSSRTPINSSKPLRSSFPSQGSTTSSSKSKYYKDSVKPIGIVDTQPTGRDSDDNTCVFEGLYPESSTFFDDVADTSTMGVIRPFYLGTKQVVEATTEACQRGRIFHTRVRCKGQLCSLVIDTRSCTNVVSEDAVKKLGLKVEPHPEPYQLSSGMDNRLN